ncbi:MAG: 5-methyltetrahydropteroyltriglutamate--homocysteine methyltransferase, partial [Halobacterium sp.]
DLQAVVPGPYSLADLATDDHYGDDADFLAAVGDFLAGEVEAFPDAVETVFLLEPSLVENPPGDGEDERASDAIDAVATAADADVVAHPYWGALDEKVHAHLLDADVDAVGYDLVSNHDDNVYNVAEYGTEDSVALGVVDGQNTLVESPETVRERVDWFEDRVPNDFEDVYVTANTGLFYLPVNRFEEKLQALAAATEEVPA